MKRTLNTREKRLLIGCLLTIFVVINALVYGQFNARLKALTSTQKRLEEQGATNKVWLDQKTLWQKRADWLLANMPYTDSAGRSQGQLLEELQNSALDAGLKVSNQTPLEAIQVSLPTNINEIVCNEVAVSLRVRGDQDKVLRWMLGLQSPERFQAMKAFEIELDTKAKEKIPQAQCNITLARWFNPTAPPGTPPPAAAPAPSIIPILPTDTPDEPAAPSAPAAPPKTEAS